MALAELIGKLRTKKQASSRTAFSHYIQAVRDMASGQECDADEVGHILEAAGVDETRLESDVLLQQQRLQWFATLEANRQAIQDRLRAENELAAARAALREACNKLQPAIDQAAARVAAANYGYSISLGAESWLAEHLLDVELIEREAAVNRQLREINAELQPLLQDREHKRHALENAEFRLSQMVSRPDDAWPGHGMLNPWRWKNEATRPVQQQVDDLKNQVAQLDAAIRPRQQEANRLQNELQKIHQEKLQP